MKKISLLLFYSFYVINSYSQEIDTTLWTTDAPIQSVARFGNTLYIGGNFNIVGPNIGHMALVSMTDGKLTKERMPHVDGDISKIISDEKGGWYIVGNFSKVQGISRNRVAHILSNNTLDLSWKPELDNINNISTAVYENGFLHIGGDKVDFSTNSGGDIFPFLTSVNVVTQQVTKWHFTEKGSITSLVVKGDTLFTGGYFYVSGQTSLVRLKVFQISNQKFISENLLLDEPIGDMKLVGNRLILVGITIKEINTANFSITNLTGTFGVGITSMLIYKDHLILGGNSYLSQGAGTKTDYLYSFDLSTNKLTNLGINLDGGINKMALLGDTLFFAGDFSKVFYQERPKIAAITLPDKRLLNWNVGLVNNKVNSLVIHKDKILLGGDFTTLGERRNRLAALNATTGEVLPWNPNVNDPDSDRSQYVFTIKPSPKGDIIYIGGNFTMVGGQGRNNMAAIRSVSGTITEWYPRVAQLSPSKFFLDNSEMYMLQSNSIAVINVITGDSRYIDLGTAIKLEDFYVKQDTAYLYGDFKTVQGQSRDGLAAIKLSNSKLLKWNPIFRTDSTAFAYKSMLVHENKVYINGIFPINGKKYGILVFDNDSGMSVDFKYTIDSYVRSIGISDSKLFANYSRNNREVLDIIDLTTGYSSKQYYLNNYIESFFAYKKVMYGCGYFTIDISQKSTRFLAAFGKDTTEENTLIYPNIVKGYVYIDKNNDCVFDKNDTPIKDIIINAEPGGYYTRTDANGYYEILLDTANYSISEILPVLKLKGKTIYQSCAEKGKIKFTNFNNEISDYNFGNIVEVKPYLEINFSSNRRRRCFLNTTTISYSNSGSAPAENAKIYVKLPEYVFLKSADKPFTKDKEGNYVFSVGTLQANQSGTINIIDSVSCVSNIAGLTQCTKVWITPSNKKTENPGYDKSDIFVSGKCLDNGFLRMGVYNFGSGNMKDSLEYRVFINAELAFKKKFKLPQNDSIIFRIPANGRTVRLEADQPKEHPSKLATNVTIENCGTSPNAFPVKGYVTKLPQDDTEPEVSIQCLPIIDSYDPNDKQVMPEGTTSQHFTPTNAELQYLIRFQNTGTDTAYTVTVIDTLSENLDIATLQVGASSHKYKFNVSGKGKPVLTWTFNNINLPDSTRNEKASNGFLSFSIRPKENLPLKTRIENFADIIFDFNDPVRTNTTLNTIYDVPLIVVNAVKLEEKAIIPLPIITSFSPSKAKVGENVTVKGKNFETLLQNNFLKIKDLQAVIQSANDSVMVFKVPQGAVSGKLNLKTSYGLAESNTELVILYPPIITSFSPSKAKVGETVTLKGKYFEKTLNDNLVRLNGTQIIIQSGNDSTLVFQVPTGATSGKITLQTSVETATSSTDFIVLYLPVITSFSPETGIPNDKVTLSGSGFDVIKTNNTVKFGDIKAEVLSASSNLLEVKVPSGFYQSKISVETAGGKSISSKDFTMLLTPLEKLPDNQITIYPNPTDGIFTVEFKEIKAGEILVFNALGEKILAKIIEKQQSQQIDMQNQPVGLYFISIRTQNGQIIRKLMLRK